MEDQHGLPEALKKASRSLQPFIKQRQEVTQIRRILSSHLSLHLNADGGLLVSRPLSLVDPISSIEATPHGVRGIQKEYLRCVRANIKARREYSKASQEHRVGLEGHHGHGPGGVVRDISTSQDGATSMESFLDLVRQRQKHERLCIIQDYIDMLSQKPAASVGHLDPQDVLKDVETLPKVPPEVVNASSSSQLSDGKDLKELVDQLEKSVLRAKMLLKREQKLLTKVQAENSTSPVSHGGRLQAVEVTRHELINWIEGELARAGDSPVTSEGQDLTKSGEMGKEYIDAELSSIQRQYIRYTKARQALIAASTGKLESPASLELDEGYDAQSMKESHSSSGTNNVIYPYLEAMISVSNEQKAMIQQKSHLTISLAKQLKESSQGLDRLADESHLLPAHPMPAMSSQRNGSEGTVSFGGQMSNHEKPDTSRRARAWVFASKSATSTTKDAISESLEEGTKSIAEGQKKLFGLQNLLGSGSEESTANTGGIGKDIWATLDGDLGAIKGDISEL